MLKVGFPLALFAYLLWTVPRSDYEAFWNQPKRWELLALAQVLALMAIVVSFFRWRLLVRAFDIPFTYTECLRLGFLGYMLNFVSLGSVGGDLFKAILVARDKVSRRPEAVASVLLDRAIGLLGLVILAWLSLMFLGEGEATPLLKGIRNAAGMIAIASIISLLVAVYAGNWFETLLQLVRKIPFAGETIVRMAEAVRRLRTQPVVIPILLGMAVSVHLMLSITVYLVSSGIYTDAPTLSEHLMVVPPGMAAGALPLAPGGLGLQEGAIAGLFEQLPSQGDREFSGLLVATVYRLITISIAGIGLIYYLGSHGREFQFVKREVQAHS